MSVVALIDTNIWVSALLNRRGKPAQVIDAWRARRFEIVTALPLLDELASVLSRPRIRDKYRLEPAEIQMYLRLIAERGVLVTPTGTLQICRDPDDDVVLETAILGQANYAVSRDDDIKRDLDLIEQMRLHNVEVVSVSRFLDLVAAFE